MSIVNKGSQAWLGAKDRPNNNCRLWLRESCGFRGAKGNKPGSYSSADPKPKRELKQNRGIDGPTQDAYNAHLRLPGGRIGKGITVSQRAG
jgi:hypothetical protein